MQETRVVGGILPGLPLSGGDCSIKNWELGFLEFVRHLDLPLSVLEQRDRNSIFLSFFVATGFAYGNGMEQIWADVGLVFAAEIGP